MGAGVVIGGVVGIRSPFDRETDAPIEVVVERRGSAFGSGSHPTTQMCVALMLELEPGGSVADLGCGVGHARDRGREARLGAGRGRRPRAGGDRGRARERGAQRRRPSTSRWAISRSTTSRSRPLLLVNAPPPVHERVAAAVDASVRHVIVSGIVTDEMPDVVKGYEAAGFSVAQGAGNGGRVDRAAAELLSPDRAAAEGAALGQLACALDDGGLLITASRLVEFGARAAILLAPGLFRLDLTPQEETLGLYPARARRVGGGLARGGGVLGRLPRSLRPGADRAARDVRRPLHGLDPRALVHGAGRLGHALRGQGGDPSTWTSTRCWSGTSGCAGRCRGARRATRTRCS